MSIIVTGNRCPVCPCTHRCVPGDGDRPTRVMLIGERPGSEEDRDGTRPFIGRSGQELNDNYLRLAGLSRDDVYLTNTVKCRNADTNRKPTVTEISECGGYWLPDEIDRCQPRFIVLLGASACSLIPDIDLDIEHGIPRFNETVMGYGPVTVIPMYHPAAGMHDTTNMIPLLEDFRRLRDVLDGTYIPPMPIPPGKYYHADGNAHVIRDGIIIDRQPLAIDTETQDGEPFSIQACWKPGTAYFAHASRYSKADAVASRLLGNRSSLRDWLQYIIYNTTRHGSIILHNAPGDLDTLERAGLVIPDNLVRDTMQEAYHLGNLPQGLKALAYRLLGVRMKSYTDVVMPPSRDKALDWIVNAVETISERYKIRTTKQLKTKLKVIDKPTPQEQGLRRILKHGCFSDEYDIWDKIGELRKRDVNTVNDPIWGTVDSAWGPLPLPGIANVPLEEAVQYGCMDADMTLRVAHRLTELRLQRERELGVAEEDKDGNDKDGDDDGSK